MHVKENYEYISLLCGVVSTFRRDVHIHKRDPNVYAKGQFIFVWSSVVLQKARIHAQKRPKYTFKVTFECICSLCGKVSTFRKDVYIHKRDLNTHAKET